MTSSASAPPTTAMRALGRSAAASPSWRRKVSAAPISSAAASGASGTIATSAAGFI
ncbi:MAG: hypothetical protein IPI02_11150 [Sterolibacteriaceae bacterium]|nr:hypothetical protein [Sterolibacteriaceae bacterium]